MIEISIYRDKYMYAYIHMYKYIGISNPVTLF